MSNINSQPPLSPGGDTNQAIMKSAGILSLGTLLSRVLGFLRDIIIARYFGTGFRADVFFLAQRIPNLFRDMVGEGAANSAVVPVLAQYQVQQDKTEFWRLVNVLSLWAMIILSLVTVMGMIFAPWIVRLMSPGFISNPVKLNLAIDLTRIMFPYLILIGLTAHSMAVLSILRSFTSAALSPCIFNIVIIASALISVHNLKEPTYGLAFGVVIGGILQLGLQMPDMLSRGYVCRPENLAHPGVKQCANLLLPRLFGSGVYQLNLVIDTICASLEKIVGAGGISAIYYANRLIQLPLGVFSYAIATAALPSLSAMAASQDVEKFRDMIMQSLKNIGFIMIPITALFIILAKDFVSVLFQRGAFNIQSTEITTQALMFFSLGLIGFSSTKILATAFYALQDTRTPVKIAAMSLIINALLNVIFMYPLKIGGIALASSIASLAGSFCLLVILQKRIGSMQRELYGSLFKILIASAVAAGGVVIFKDFIVLREGFWGWGRVLILCFLFAAIFLLCAWQMKIAQVLAVEKALRSRF